MSKQKKLEVSAPESPVPTHRRGTPLDLSFSFDNIPDLEASSSAIDLTQSPAVPNAGNASTPIRVPKATPFGLNTTFKQGDHGTSIIIRAPRCVCRILMLPPLQNSVCPQATMGFWLHIQDILSWGWVCSYVQVGLGSHKYCAR